MLPPAPPRFSTSTGWPRRSDIFWPTSRATVSAKPPAANATTVRTGLAGYACASAPDMPLAAAMPAIAAATLMFLLMVPPPFECRRQAGLGFAVRALFFPEAREDLARVALEDFLPVGVRQRA